jgi:hypothetical protein
MTAFGGKADMSRNSPLIKRILADVARLRHSESGVSQVSERPLATSVHVRAKRGQRVQVCRWMIAHQIDGPGADDEERWRSR